MNVVAVNARDRWRSLRMAMEDSRWRSTPWGRRPESMLGLVTPILDRMLRKTAVYRRGVRNALDLRLRRVEFTCPGLAQAFDGFTILHISDIHPICLDGIVEQAGQLVDGLEVDLAVATGDFQHRGRPDPWTTAALLAPLFWRLRSRHGVVAVLGNHDRHGMADALESMGVRVLINEHMAIRREDRELRLIGVDDVQRFYTEDAARALQAEEDGFRLLLAHSPDFATQAEQAGIGLYLSGHTHGGQVCLPGGLPIATACDRQRRLARGAWRVGRMLGYTSSGVGVGMPPLRFNSHGEVALITLRADGPD